MRIFILGANGHSCAFSGEGAALRVLPLAAYARDTRPRHGREQIVRATSLDWTIARPPRLINRADEAYRSVRDELSTRPTSPC